MKTFRWLMARSGLRLLPLHARIYEFARIVRASVVLGRGGRHG